MNNQIKNIYNTKYFDIEYYKNKPHWTTDYFDVLSGCKDSFDDYKKKILKDPFKVSTTFIFDDFETATFEIKYQLEKVNPYEIAYIKVSDTNKIFGDGKLKEVYFFVTNVRFLSTGVARFACKLDYWMTYWPLFKFNGLSLVCQRKHFPRYRTDKNHIGEYDFSPNSPVCNVDNIELNFQNLLSSVNYDLFTEYGYSYVKPMSQDNFAYAFILPEEDDQVGYVENSELKFLKVSDIIGPVSVDNSPKYRRLLHFGGTQSEVPQGCPWLVFSVTSESEVGEALKIKSIYDTTSVEGHTSYKSFDYRLLTTNGIDKRIASVQIFDHPIIQYDNNTATKLLIIDNIIENNDRSIQSIIGLSIDDIVKLKGWSYELSGGMLLPFYKPSKDYSENDNLSLDQEPALFRFPHFEMEYSLYSCKGIYKVHNELLLSEGFFDSYGTLFCDYVLHLMTTLKYVYVKNGWYKYQYDMWKYGLFEENIYSIDLINDAYKSFLQQNLNRFNTSVNQNMWNSGWGVALGAIAFGAGLFFAPETGGLSIQMAAAGAGMMQMLNSTKSGIFQSQQYQAQLKDLQRTPSTMSNQSNSFSNLATKQMGNSRSSNGSLCIRQHRENEQWILYWHFHQHGYLVNKRLTIPNLQWFYSRTWFDYFLLEDFSNVINQNDYNQMIINKFNNIFKRGVRLWHTIDNFLNYEKNNKEISSWKETYLKEQ